jgi:predicted metal-binding transcription factor (methanogenesis marker protein 9)
VNEALTAFCVPGRHSGPIVGTVSDGGTEPEGWQLVRASFDREAQEWFEDDSSGARILCCPEHRPRVDTQQFWLDAKVMIEARDEATAKRMLDAIFGGAAADTVQAPEGLRFFDRTGLAEEETK